MKLLAFILILTGYAVTGFICFKIGYFVSLEDQADDMRKTANEIDQKLQEAEK